jgi:hypothetical protein
LLAYRLARDVSSLRDRAQGGVLDAQERRRLLEREHLGRVFPEGRSTHDKAVVGREMLTHCILDKPALALPGAVGDIMESLSLISRQADIQGNIVTRHSVDDIN